MSNSASFSQSGEDLIVARLFTTPGRKSKLHDESGWYTAGRILEIGAFHPTVFSNSRLFIEKGWSAVLIDASPWAIVALLEEYGKGAQPVTIIQAAVICGDEKLCLMRLTPDGVSSSDPGVIATWDEKGGYKGWACCATITPEQISLQFGGFDIISIDIEGRSTDLALRCLKLGWEPKVYIIEHDNRLVELLGPFNQAGYRAVSTNGVNVVLSR